MQSAAAGGERPLRVAVVAPPWFRVPPEGYGGIESVAAELVDQLVERGHEVTLVGHGGHGLRARAIPTYPEPQGERLGVGDVEVAHAAATQRVIERLRPDVVHDHSLAGPLLAALRPCPTVATVHGPVTDDLSLYYRSLGDQVGLVAISQAQRSAAPELPWVATVHNAVSVERYPFRRDKSDYLLFLGRCTADKGVDLAITAARAAGRRLVLAMKCSEPAEHEYFQSTVRPLLGDDVEFAGEVGGRRKLELLSGASALLLPIRWDEPFGMVAIEGMACGTPIVACRRGALPEIVEDGRTGVLVDDPADLSEAIGKAAAIDPAACRERVEQRFASPVMAASYEAVYRAAVVSRTADTATSLVTTFPVGNRRSEVAGTMGA